MNKKRKNEFFYQRGLIKEIAIIAIILYVIYYFNIDVRSLVDYILGFFR